MKTSKTIKARVTRAQYRRQLAKAMPDGGPVAPASAEATAGRPQPLFPQLAAWRSVDLECELIARAVMRTNKAIAQMEAALAAMHRKQKARLAELASRALAPVKGGAS
ncbi:MAG: hypothetical protein HZA93_23715 [Verrucomicrobia bacterium]|nr:hypothetical protein [Verrucomicrobiota bacterium]